MIYNFSSSNWTKRGYQPYVGGKIHKNDYCNFIKDLTKDHNLINLLDYVNEIDKSWLYLNSEAFVSPYSTEAFVISALDASSLEMPAILSQIPSHVETRKRLDKNKNITLIANNRKEWP